MTRRSIENRRIFSNISAGAHPRPWKLSGLRTGVLADNELFEARTEFRRSEQARIAAEQTLASLGAGMGGVTGEVTLRSPLDGVVVAREKARGERIAAGDPLLTVLNPSHVWAWVDLPDERLALRLPAVAKRSRHATK